MDVFDIGLILNIIVWVAALIFYAVKIYPDKESGEKIREELRSQKNRLALDARIKKSLDLDARYHAFIPDLNEAAYYLWCGEHFDEICNKWGDFLKIVLGDSWRVAMREVIPRYRCDIDMSFAERKRDEMETLVCDNSDHSALKYLFMLQLASMGKLYGNNRPFYVVGGKQMEVEIAIMKAIEEEINSVTGTNEVRFIREYRKGDYIGNSKYYPFDVGINHPQRMW